jgi:hypothetical protein
MTGKAQDSLIDKGTLQKLGELLNDDDADSADLLGELIQQNSDPKLQLLLSDMQTSITDYDFEQALVQLDDLMASIDKNYLEHNQQGVSG